MRPTIRQMLKVKRSTLSQAVFTTFYLRLKAHNRFQTARPLARGAAQHFDSRTSHRTSSSDFQPVSLVALQVLLFSQNSNLNTVVELPVIHTMLGV